MKPIRIAVWILVSASLLFLFACAWLAQYAHPMGDDWSYARMGMDHGLLPWLKDQYFTWNGRYFSNALVGRGPLTLGIDHLWMYRCVPVVLIALTWCAYTAFLRALFRDAFTHMQTWAAGLVFTALFLHGMPDLGEGIYWYTGAVTYQLGTCLLLFHLAAFFMYLQGRYVLTRVPHIFLNVVLALLVVGSSEVHMLLLLVIHAVILVVRWRNAKRPTKAEWVMITTVLLGAAVMYFAPGNAVRASYFDTKHELWRSLGWSVLQTGRFTGLWLIDRVLFFTFFLYVPLSRDLSRRVPLFQRSFGLTPLTSTLALLSVTFLCVFPAYWSTGMLGQHRTLNVAYAFFLPLWFINLTVWTNRFNYWSAFSSKPWAIVTFIAIAMIGLFISRNGSAVTSDLFTGTAADFDRQMNARYELLLNEENDSQTGSTLPLRHNR